MPMRSLADKKMQGSVAGVFKIDKLNTSELKSFLKGGENNIKVTLSL